MTLDIIAVAVLVLIDIVLIVVWRRTENPFVQRNDDAN